MKPTDMPRLEIPEIARNAAQMRALAASPQGRAVLIEWRSYMQEMRAGFAENLAIVDQVLACLDDALRRLDA